MLHLDLTFFVRWRLFDFISYYFQNLICKVYAPFLEVLGQVFHLVEVFMHQEK